MPTVALCPLPKLQFLDENGDLLTGGLLYTYTVGTTTPQATYSDSTGDVGVLNANPVVMNARGEPTSGGVWLLTSANYKLVLKTAAGATIWTVDGIGYASPTFQTLTVTGALTVGGQSVVGPTVGKESVPISAVSMKPSLTAGCADIAAISAGASKPDIIFLAFDTTTSESCQFSIRMPTNWNEGTITFDYQWSHAATTVNFGVVFGLSAVAISNDDTIGAAFGTEITIADTGGTTDDMYISPESAAMTVAGTPQAGDVVYFNLARKTADGSDTMAIDARVSGITLYITTDAAIG